VLIFGSAEKAFYLLCIYFWQWICFELVFNCITCFWGWPVPPIQSHDVGAEADDFHGGAFAVVGVWVFLIELPAVVESRAFVVHAFGFRNDGQSIQVVLFDAEFGGDFFCLRGFRVGLAERGSLEFVEIAIKGGSAEVLDEQVLIEGIGEFLQSLAPFFCPFLDGSFQVYDRGAVGFDLKPLG